jgi:hypothetical protein
VSGISMEDSPAAEEEEENVVGKAQTCVEYTS